MNDKLPVDAAKGIIESFHTEEQFYFLPMRCYVDAYLHIQLLNVFSFRVDYLEVDFFIP